MTNEIKDIKTVPELMKQYPNGIWICRHCEEARDPSIDHFNIETLTITDDEMICSVHGVQFPVPA